MFGTNAGTRNWHIRSLGLSLCLLGSSISSWGSGTLSLVDMLTQGGGAQERYAQVQSLMDLAGGSRTSGSQSTSAMGPGDPKDWEQVARGMVPDNYAFNALDSIIERESHWNPHALNESSGAAGIAQRISGFGPGYRENKPVQQINWLLNYIDDRYGNPQNALQHKNQTGWY
jgi:hypothetical protein